MGCVEYDYNGHPGRSHSHTSLPFQHLQHVLLCHQRQWPPQVSGRSGARASSWAAFASDNSEMNTCVHQRKQGGARASRERQTRQRGTMKIKLLRSSMAG